MTAKQLLDNATVVTSLGGYRFGEKQMRAFIDQLCKEQREICADHIAVWNDAETNAKLIINAKQPEV